MDEKKTGLYCLISEYRKELMGFAALWILFFHKWLLLFESVPIIGQLEFFLRTSDTSERICFSSYREWDYAVP